MDLRNTNPTTHALVAAEFGPGENQQLPAQGQGGLLYLLFGVTCW